MDAQRGIARRMVIGLPPGGLTPAWERDFSAFPPAGVIVFRSDFQELAALRRLTARLRELARPRRLFIAMDEEGGHVSQLAGHLVVPPNAATLARGASAAELEWIARVSGERLRALGVDWVFAPVADIHSEPRNPVIGARAWGVDPEGVAERIGALRRGYRAAGVASCLKHFPGHGDTVRDSHATLPRCDATRATLDARELLPFRAHRDADAIMTAHVLYPALDPDRPATFSKPIVHDVLRGELGFTGVSITDALEMKGAAEARSAFETGRLALDAGCDLLLFAFHDEAVRRARLELAHALADGTIAHEFFDAARPRLAELDRRTAPPTDADLARPLEDLTPPDWVPRLEAAVERALIVQGSPPAVAGPWRVWNAGPEHLSPIAAELEARGLRPAAPKLGVPLLDELRAAGVPAVEDDGAARAIAVVATRAPLDPQRLEALRDACRRTPTVVVGLQNDAFLDQVPEAAATVSASDATPLTRRVVARRLAQFHAAPARV